MDGLDVAMGEATLELQAGDTVLLCPDSLWEPVEEAEMLRWLALPSLHAAARGLVESA